MSLKSIRRGFLALARSYIVGRLAQTLIVFFSALTITFFLYRLMPGGPVEIMVTQMLSQTGAGESISATELKRAEQLVETYTNIDPNKPVHIAYVQYLSEIVLHQDFGESLYQNEPVFQLLFSRMPWSIFISIYGLIIGRTVSLLLGALMAYKEGSKFDTGLTAFTVLNSSIPYYIIAVLSLIVFSFNLGWFPSGGRMDPSTTPGYNLPFMIGVIKHGALPILSTFIAGFGGALAFRGNCIREMGKEYLEVAHLRGVSGSRIAIRYVGRNAFLPIYTGLLMGIAGIFGSGIIIERIFTYPAVGYVTFGAVLNRDFPLLMGAFIFYTTITLAGILVADLTYGIIDPRVKGGGDRESF
jgi:peptide/nickel transport system permease protein